MHLLSTTTFILLTSLQLMVSSKVHPELKASSIGVSTYRSEIEKTIDKSDVNPGAAIKDLLMLSDRAEYPMVHWLPYEYLAAFESDKDYIGYLKKSLSQYIIVFVMTDPDKPKKSDNWILSHCRLQLATGEKLVPVTFNSLPIDTKNIINDYKVTMKEYSGKSFKNSHVVVFAGRPTSGVRYVDPVKSGSFQILLDQSSIKFNTPIKSLAPKVTCVSCSFVLDSEWQYCPKCSKFIEKKK